MAEKRFSLAKEIVNCDDTFSVIHTLYSFILPSSFYFEAENGMVHVFIGWTMYPNIYSYLLLFFYCNTKLSSMYKRPDD